MHETILEIPVSPDIMKENKEYKRKRRPINFTIPDLEADAEEDNDLKYPMT